MRLISYSKTPSPMVVSESPRGAVYTSQVYVRIVCAGILPDVYRPPPETSSILTSTAS